MKHIEIRKTVETMDGAVLTFLERIDLECSRCGSLGYLEGKREWCSHPNCEDSKEGLQRLIGGA